MLRWLAGVLLLAGAVAAFVGLASYQLALPGLYYDEAADAVPAMQIVLNQPIELSRDAGISWNGRTWPLMVMDYVGSVSTYLLVPSIQLLGVKTEAVRAMPIAVGALALLVGFGALRALYGGPVALLAIWLTAITPSFVFWTRQGIHVSSIMLICTTAALWLLVRWWRGTGGWNLALAGLILGLGISIKLLFVWFPVALVVAGLLLAPWFRRRSLARSEKPTAAEPSKARNDHRPDPDRSIRDGTIGVLDRTEIASQPVWPLPAGRTFPFVRWPDLFWLPLAAVLFVVGAGFIILYNVQTMGTITILTQNAVTTAYGVDNRAFLPNLLTRIDAFGTYLRGDHFWYLGEALANPIWPVAFVGAIVALVLLIAVDPVARRRWRLAALPVVIIAAVVSQSTVTVSGLGPTHFYLLFPLPQAVVALAVVWAIDLARRRRWALPLAVVGAVTVAGLVAVDLMNDAGYHTTLARTGGYGNYSDSIVDLAGYLDEWKGHQPVAMDWGISKPVQFLTEGRVNPIELFGYTGPNDPTLEDRLQPYLAKPFTLYIFHDDGSTNYPRYRAFADATKAYGKYVRRELLIEQRDGKPLFRLYTANQD